MRFTRSLLATVVVLGCTDPRAPDESNAVTDVLSITAPIHSVAGGNFHAHATGAQEVPVRDTRAQGQANFRIDGDVLHYRLNVANILNVTQAHIHLGPAGVNGPIVVWLYPSAPPLQLIPGRSQGTLGEGTITDADLVGMLAGQTVADLLEHIRAGNAYVNVHTTQFPPGEIRGQIR